MPILDEAGLAGLQAPEGFRWTVRPKKNEYYFGRPGYEGSWYEPGVLKFREITALTEEQYCRLSRNLYDWVVTNNIHVELYDYHYGPAGTWSQEVFYTFYVFPTASIGPATITEGRWGRQKRCSQNHTWNGGWICPTCQENVKCVGCTRVESTNYIPQLSAWGCDACVRYCGHAGCSTVFIGNFFECETHGDRQPCGGGCGTITEASSRWVVGDKPYCSRCKRRVCDICEEFKTSRLPVYEDIGMQVCPQCMAANPELNNTGHVDETFDDSGEVDLKLASTKVRPIRMCSIEVEAATGGRELAQKLYEAGLTPHRDVLNYHSSRDAFCHVEMDSSLGGSGGELIFNRILLDEDEDVSKLAHGLKVVRELVKSGDASMTTRCGLHIHVDGHNMGIGHVRNLVLIHNYLEDVLYRLAAANYPRHRGQRYAIKGAKGEKYFKDDASFGLHYMGTDQHHSALHIGNYWRAINQNCQCGQARLFKDVVKCECNLGKCTFEFRIYNGTTSFRKIHAYAALSQSMVAYARATTQTLTEQTHPPMDFKPFYKDLEPIKPEWMRRLRWLFGNLPFTTTEKDSLLYCIKSSSLSNLGELEIERLRNVPYVGPSDADYELIHRNRRGTVTNTTTTPNAPVLNFNLVEYDEIEDDDPF